MVVLPVLRARWLVLGLIVCVLAVIGFAVGGPAGLVCAALLPMLGIVAPEEEFQAKVLSGVTGLQEAQKKFETLLAQKDADITKVKEAMNELSVKMAEHQKKQQLMRRGFAAPGKVSDECARMLGAVALVGAAAQEKLRGMSLDTVDGIIKDVFGVTRTALATSDIPMPVGYGGEVVELVSQYGAARRLGTVYPLGNGVTNLPRLKTSPAFGLIPMSGSTEVSPQVEFVTFTAQKFGGIIRIPSEIEEDSVVSIGQFLARYAAREMAKVEDHNFFVGTGASSGANGAVAGLCASTITNTKVVQMGSTKTKRSDTTLANLRALRSVVDAAALPFSRYAMHPSFEQHLSGLNTAGDKPYQAVAGRGATLDGYPIEWVDIMPVYSTSATISTVHVLFGDFSYQYLGVRGGMRFDVSKEAGFTTDETLVRALERFTIGLMATGAIGGLETAGS